MYQTVREQKKNTKNYTGNIAGMYESDHRRRHFGVKFLLKVQFEKILLQKWIYT